MSGVGQSWLADETLRNVEETLPRSQQFIYCTTSLMSVLLGVAFGRRSLQTSPRHTYFCRGRYYYNKLRSLEELKYNIE